ncbi:hypothetical protein N878_07925 [Pseudomonas sp. EGD-AK9]|nr:hypothetical protein N878_07925 [Pseudomonas sp. EGD-AK9]
MTALMLGALLDAGIARVGAHYVFRTVQQLVDQGDIGYVELKNFVTIY